MHQSKTTTGTNITEELLAYKYKHIENSAQTRLAYSYSPEKLNTYIALESQDVTRSFGVIQNTKLGKNDFYINPITTFCVQTKKRTEI